MRVLLRVSSACLLMAALFAAGAWGESKPQIQIALLLDTSNSMDGLINQAKSQLWKVVNEFATAQRQGERPELTVALFEYGKSSLPSGEGYLRMILPLTTDLDRVSEELFALTTNGGQEYCGRVIKEAVEKLGWSASHKNLKAIFIAGNEPFTQGGVDYREACKGAIAKGVIVNTIHCGSYDQGVQGKWKDGALLADGKYMHIDQNRVVAHIEAPQDTEIEKLGAALNETYIPYGSMGASSMARQSAQDVNAENTAKGVAVQRALFKASVHYKNAAWDLVDAVREGQVKLDTLQEDALPEKMQNMTQEEQNAYIETQYQKRQVLQEQITKLDQERKAYVAEKMKEAGRADTDSLDTAMIKAIRAQAEAKQFEFKQ